MRPPLDDSGAAECGSQGWHGCPIENVSPSALVYLQTEQHHSAPKGGAHATNTPKPKPQATSEASRTECTPGYSRCRGTARKCACGAALSLLRRRALAPRSPARRGCAARRARVLRVAALGTRAQGCAAVPLLTHVQSCKPEMDPGPWLRRQGGLRGQQGPIRPGRRRHAPLLPQKLPKRKFSPNRPVNSPRSRPDRIVRSR